jgi:urease beta subunit
MKDVHLHLEEELTKLGYSVRCNVVYVGSIFTVAEANATIDFIKEDHTTSRMTLHSEGASRRSPQDKPNAVMGRTIAEGRALKALYLKAQGIKDLHRHHLLMG